MATVLQRPALRNVRAPRRKHSWRLLVTICGWALLAAGLWLRVWRLDTLPGVNGDEAWYGVQAQRLLSGESIAWRTPTGNVLNVFFFGPQVLLHAVLAPDFLLLRIPALVSGLAALGLNYWFCRRLFDGTTAVLSTLLLAVMPLNIAYSRMAWDASQSLLATLLVLYVSLSAARASLESRWKWRLAMFATLCAAVLVHPTNVFVAPVALAAILFADSQSTSRVLDRGGALDGSAAREDGMPQSRGAGKDVARWIGIVGVVCLFALVAWLIWPPLVSAAGHLSGPSDFFTFVVGFVRLVSGVTVLQYFAGSVSAESGFDLHRAVYDVPAALLLILSGWGMYRSLRVDGSTLDRCLAAGWLATMLGFFVVAGPRALEAHWERYAICLVAPTALVVARGGAWWIGQSRHRGAITLALIAMGFAWLGGFYSDCFAFCDRTGGQSHVALRTGAVEPKRAAWNYIQAESGANAGTHIIAGDWWTYWPISYLAGTRANVKVDLFDDVSGHTDDELGKIWFVDFVESPQLPVRLRSLGKRTELVQRSTVADAGGRPLIEIFGPPE